jgi:hypothetical protein
MLAKYEITSKGITPYKWLPVARPEQCKVQLTKVALTKVRVQARAEAPV